MSLSASCISSSSPLPRKFAKILRNWYLSVTCSCSNHWLFYIFVTVHVSGVGLLWWARGVDLVVYVARKARLLLMWRFTHIIRIHRRATRVGASEVFEAAHVALRTLLAFSQPVNCIFWPIGMLNWLVAASKLHKHRETCCTAEWRFYVFLFYGFTLASRPRNQQNCRINYFVLLVP